MSDIMSDTTYPYTQYPQDGYPGRKSNGLGLYSSFLRKKSSKLNIIFFFWDCTSNRNSFLKITFILVYFPSNEGEEVWRTEKKVLLSIMEYLMYQLIDLIGSTFFHLLYIPHFHYYMNIILHYHVVMPLQLRLVNLSKFGPTRILVFFSIKWLVLQINKETWTHRQISLPPFMWHKP